MSMVPADVVSEAYACIEHHIREDRSLWING